MATWKTKRGAVRYNHDIKGTEGNDHLSTKHDSDTVQALGGNDTIDNKVSADIYCGKGHDIVNSSGVGAKIYGEDGNDSISASSLATMISGGEGNDTVIARVNQAMIYGDAGEDYISDYGTQSKLYGGAGNDTILSLDPGPNGDKNIGKAMFMDGGDGNDYIRNEALENLHVLEFYGFRSGSRRPVKEVRKSSSTINGGAGNDTIENRGSDVTIEGGKGDDQISLGSGASNNFIQYNAGDGNDTITGFNATSTLKIGDGKGVYSTLNDNSDIMVFVGDGAILLKGAASLSNLNIQGTKSTVVPVVKGTDGDDSINNNLSRSTINAGKGNDQISLGSGASNNFI